MKHPAKFSDPILVEMAGMLSDATGWLLDPFAGTGRVHTLQTPELRSTGIEIEPEWAEMHPQTVVGDALHLPFPDGSIDVVATSPTYGNRMADHHNARENSKRNTYKHTLGRDLHPNNSGQLQWGPAYREFHNQAWSEVKRVLKSDGSFILNISNHIRKGEEIDVTGWHLENLQGHGFKVLYVRTVKTSRYKEGTNAHLRVDGEQVALLVPSDSGI